MKASTSLNSGITWQSGNSLQRDAGTQFGVTGNAPIFAPFYGFSIRFYFFEIQRIAALVLVTPTRIELVLSP